MLVELAIKLYLQTLTNQSTKLNYEIALNDFNKQVTYMKDLTEAAVISFRETLNSKSPQTISSRMSAIRSFLMHCWSEGWIDFDPSLTIKIDSVKRYTNAKNLSFDDLKKILSFIKTSTLLGVRDYLLIRLLFLVGDPQEVLALKMNSPIPDIVMDAKKLYVQKLSEHIRLTQLKTGFLFFSLDHLEGFNPFRPLSRAGARKILRKYASEAGFDPKVIDFTAIKRLRARQIFEQTSSFELVQKFCGHSDIRQTKTFLKTLGFKI